MLTFDQVWIGPSLFYGIWNRANELSLVSAMDFIQVECDEIANHSRNQCANLLIFTNKALGDSNLA
jgi:hypothetical protein